MISSSEKWTGIVLTSVEEAIEGELVADVDDIELAVERAVQSAKGHTSVVNLIFGIDPGPRPGLAWIADGMIVGTAQLETIEELSGHIFSLAKSLEYENLIVKVGNGARLIRDRILNQLILHGVETLIVSEYNTSSGSRIKAHTKAATRIAMMGGKRVYQLRDIEPNEGEIKEIQNESRVFSNGAITISAELATQVACGDITLDEAIKKS